MPLLRLGTFQACLEIQGELAVKGLGFGRRGFVPVPLTVSALLGSYLLRLRTIIRK